MRKFFVFDIDGTLLDEGKKMPVSTRESIRRLREAGHEVGIATGRNFKSAFPVIEELELDMYIVCNGAVGFVDHEKVYETTLPREDIERLIALARENGDQLVFATVDDYRRHFEVHGEAMSKVFGDYLHLQPEWDEEFWKRDSIIQCNLFCKPEDVHLYELESVRLVSWHDYGRDIIDKGMSKAKTILQIAEDKGFAREDVVFFGDGHNDIEALQFAGLGIAMGNAADEVKRHADYVTAHVGDDGILKGLQAFGLL